MDILNALMVTLSFLLMINNCQGIRDDKSVENCCSVCLCPASKLRNITVDCSDRNLIEVPRCEWSNVRTLHLQGNRISEISSKVFHNMRKLRYLDLRNNDLRNLPELNVTMNNLRQLILEQNRFTRVPSAALSKMPKLKTLQLSFNLIEEIPKNSFKNQKKLEDLYLHGNNLKKIEAGFMGKAGGNLIVLDLSSTKLRRIPFNSIRRLKKLQLLDLHSTELLEIPDFAFKGLNKLKYINLHDIGQLKEIGTKAFTFLPNLLDLQLIRHGLTQFPNLTGTNSLLDLELQENEIEEIPENFCKDKRVLRKLNMNFNNLKKLPKFSYCEKLVILECDHNSIRYIGNSLNGLKNLMDFTIKGNRIESIGKDDFKGLEKLQNILLDDNSITNIHEEAFSSFKHLKRIDLRNNKFPTLPTKGIHTIESLTIKGNTKLVDFPSRSNFPYIKKIEVQYAYHCCPFKSEGEDGNDDDRIEDLQVEWSWLESSNVSEYTDLGSGLFNATDALGTELPYIPYLSKQVTCHPKPDAFSPCDDLMGDWLLRCGVWVVFLLALTGNATVIIVILASHTKMDVSRFLISNLAFADLFMGIYLGFLAVVDVSTLGNFKSYGLKWQMSAGCQTAGFLAVMSSELSVFTLTVITLERYIAIKNAIRVNRKLELKTAIMVMVIGWLFAIVTATLPLVEINTYGKFSVCLPFETENTQSIVFLTLLLCLNATAFAVILCCYILMYCSIRGSNAWNANDFRVAKRMALLVFTDFVCWAPIVFLSLTAAFGSTLVSLDHAKIFTVFVFPLNSCANPFLYAIFTSHFKKDIVNLCRRVEDKCPFLKITKQKISFSRRSSYSGAISENANVYLRVRRLSLPIFTRGFHNSITSHDKAGSSASSNSNKSPETNALVQPNGEATIEKETCV